MPNVFVSFLCIYICICILPSLLFSSFIVTLTAIFVHKVLLSILPGFRFFFWFYVYVSLALAVCLLLVLYHQSSGHCIYKCVCCLFVSLNGKFKLPFNLSLSPLWLSPVACRFPQAASFRASVLFLEFIEENPCRLPFAVILALIFGQKEGTRHR